MAADVAYYVVGCGEKMIVHFIGAGPGAPDLLTLRGRDHIARSPVCLYAGSLVPKEILAHAPPHARIMDTAEMTLDEIIAEIAAAHARDEDVARLHSGDLSIWSACAEQMRRLDALGNPLRYDAGRAPRSRRRRAALGQELTLPRVAQTVILTRTAARSTPMPQGEDLATLGRSGATLAIHLSVANLDAVVAQLTPLYGADAPVAVVFRASWPDERVVRGMLSDIAEKIAEAGIDRTALIFVGRALARSAFGESYLYSAQRDRTQA